MSDANLRLDLGFDVRIAKTGEAGDGCGARVVDGSAGSDGFDRGDDTLRLCPEIPFTESEAHRHACEVRHLVAKGREWSVEFCRGVAGKRGRAAAEKLWRDARAEAKRVGAWVKS